MSDEPESVSAPSGGQRRGERDAPAARRKHIARHVHLDRSLEALPLFRLSDSSDDSALVYTTPSGGRWRVIPYPGDRLPGTFDQDVYVEIMRRYHDSGAPDDRVVAFTLHSFLRSMGRRADGRTYGQLRATLSRLENTLLESVGAYFSAAESRHVDASFTLLSSVKVDRRRSVDRSQLHLFPSLPSAEPGFARVMISPQLTSNISAGYTATLSAPLYSSLHTPVARRLYRLLQALPPEHASPWRIPVLELARMLPIVQKYPSHVLRVLHPAHGMLIAAGLVDTVRTVEADEGALVEYAMAGHR